MASGKQPNVNSIIRTAKQRKQFSTNGATLVKANTEANSGLVAASASSKAQGKRKREQEPAKVGAMRLVVNPNGVVRDSTGRITGLSKPLAPTDTELQQMPNELVAVNVQEGFWFTADMTSDEVEEALTSYFPELFSYLASVIPKGQPSLLLCTKNYKKLSLIPGLPSGQQLFLNRGPKSDYRSCTFYFVTAVPVDKEVLAEWKEGDEMFGRSYGDNAEGDSSDKENDEGEIFQPSKRVKVEQVPTRWIRPNAADVVPPEDAASSSASSVATSSTSFLRAVEQPSYETIDLTSDEAEPEETLPLRSSFDSELQLRQSAWSRYTFIDF